PIVFTPGTGNMHARAFFTTAVAACTRLKRRALLLTQYEGQGPSRLPTGIRSFHYVPLGQLLPPVAALVHPRGIGTVSQALAAGVPQLICPMAYDQPDNAARVKRLGIGDWLAPRSFQIHAVKRKLRSLLNSAEVAQRCRMVAARLQNSHALEATCQLVERL